MSREIEQTKLEITIYVRKEIVSDTAVYSWCYVNCRGSQIVSQFIVILMREYDIYITLSILCLYILSHDMNTNELKVSVTITQQNPFFDCQVFV